MIQKATKMCRNNEKQCIPFLKESLHANEQLNSFRLCVQIPSIIIYIIINFYSSFSHKTVQLFVRSLFGHMSTLF